MQYVHNYLIMLNIICKKLTKISLDNIPPNPWGEVPHEIISQVPKSSTIPGVYMIPQEGAGRTWCLYFYSLETFFYDSIGPPPWSQFVAGSTVCTISVRNNSVGWTGWREKAASWGPIFRRKCLLCLCLSPYQFFLPAVVSVFAHSRGITHSFHVAQEDEKKNCWQMRHLWHLG